MDSKLTTIKETRHFYSAARAVLGADQVADIYKCSTRHIYRWAADPDFCEVAQRNPIDRLISVMRRLCEMGRDDVAHAAVSLMAASVGAELRIPSTELFETGKNISDEAHLRALEMRLVAILQRTIEDMDALIATVRAAIPDDHVPAGIPATIRARREYYKFKRRSEAT